MCIIYVLEDSSLQSVFSFCINVGTEDRIGDPIILVWNVRHALLPAESSCQFLKLKAFSPFWSIIKFYRWVEISIRFPLVALRELVCEGTEFPQAVALMTEPLLVDAELQLVIRMTVVEGAATELVEKQQYGNTETRGNGERRPELGVRNW